jgi:hypothetical protein
LASLVFGLACWLIAYLYLKWVEFTRTKLLVNPTLRLIVGLTKELPRSKDLHSKDHHQSQPHTDWRRFRNVVAKYLPMFFLFALVVALFFVANRVATIQTESILPWMKGWIAAYTLIGVLFLVNFGMILLRVVTAEPPLPDVRITLSDTNKIAVGKLIDHSEGTWHFFDREWTLKAIPDEQVREVEVCEETDKESSPHAT